MLCEDQLGVPRRLFTCRAHIHKGLEAAEDAGKTREQEKVRGEAAAEARAPGPKQVAVREAEYSLSAKVSRALKMQAGIVSDYKTRKHSNRTLTLGRGSFRDRVRTLPSPAPLKN